MNLRDELRAMTLTSNAMQEHERLMQEEEVARVNRKMRAKAKEAALSYFTGTLPGQMKDAALRGEHSIKVHYSDYRDAEKMWMEELANICRENSFEIKWDSYTSDYGDSAAPAVHTSHYLIVSWK